MKEKGSQCFRWQWMPSPTTNHVFRECHVKTLAATQLCAYLVSKVKVTSASQYIGNKIGIAASIG
jgi:hypothetical protein